MVNEWSIKLNESESIGEYFNSNRTYISPVQKHEEYLNMIKSGKNYEVPQLNNHFIVEEKESEILVEVDSLKEVQDKINEFSKSINHLERFIKEN